MASTRPFFVIIPGASQTPSHYAYLSHLLNLAGFPTISALLPSLGATKEVTAQDDTDYIRDRMLLPILDHSKRDVIMIMHSYSGMPGSAAAAGLSPSERTAQGKTTSVIGQIFITAMLIKGGDGTDILAAVGGQYPESINPNVIPPHIITYLSKPNKPSQTQINLLSWPNPIPALFQQVPTTLAIAAAASAVPQGITSFNSPCPPTTWDSEHFKGRLAYVRARNDAMILLETQQAMIDATGVEWIVRDLESDHSPQLSTPEELVGILLELGGMFERL